MTHSYKVGDRVLCTYPADPKVYGKVGTVVGANERTYYVDDDYGNPFSPDGWSQENSFIKIPSKTKPLKQDRIIEGVKVVFVGTITPKIMGEVGNIYRVTESTFRARKLDAGDIGGGYWAKDQYPYFHEVIEDSPSTLRSGSSGIAIQEVTIPIVIGSPCPLKYYGTDSCTCGTCPPKKDNPFFLKF